MSAASFLAGRPLRSGSIALTLPNGRTLDLRGGREGPSAAIVLHRWRALARFLAGGSVGFGEAYMDGDWDSPDLPKLIETAARNLPSHPGPFRRLSPWRIRDLRRHVAAPNTRRGSAKNIAAHYDLGNDFYALWLDPSMTYSAAVFSGGANDLESAQSEKYRRLLDLIEAKPGQHVIEIGCGWGGFALLAARERGIRVTAVTISRAQHDEAMRRVAEAGLQDRIDAIKSQAAEQARIAALSCAPVLKPYQCSYDAYLKANPAVQVWAARYPQLVPAEKARLRAVD